MSIRRVTPKPRWVYTTDNMSDEMVDEILVYRDKWIGDVGNSFHLPISRLDFNKQWVCLLISEVPEPALDGISNGLSELWIEVQYGD